MTSSAHTLARPQFICQAIADHIPQQPGAIKRPCLLDVLSKCVCRASHLPELTDALHAGLLSASGMPNLSVHLRAQG